MNADEARKLSDEAKEPRTVKQAFDQVRNSAKIGFNNTTVLVPKNNHDFYTELTLAMVQAGFRTYRDDYDGKNYCVTIEWN